jgi:hypothetical protein
MDWVRHVVVGGVVAWLVVACTPEPSSETGTPTTTSSSAGSSSGTTTTPVETGLTEASSSGGLDLCPLPDTVTVEFDYDDGALMQSLDEDYERICTIASLQEGPTVSVVLDCVDENGAPIQHSLEFTSEPDLAMPFAVQEQVVLRVTIDDLTLGLALRAAGGELLLGYVRAAGPPTVEDDEKFPNHVGPTADYYDPVYFSVPGGDCGFRCKQEVINPCFCLRRLELGVRVGDQSHSMHDGQVVEMGEYSVLVHRWERTDDEMCPHLDSDFRALIVRM